MKSPLYALVAFLIVEGLIASGFVNRNDAQAVQTQLEDVFFYGFLALTGLVGFIKYLEAHKHHVSVNAEVEKAGIAEESSVKNPVPVEPVFTEIDSGTPQPPAEQNIVSNYPVLP